MAATRPAPAPTRQRLPPEGRATAAEVWRLLAAAADETIALGDGRELRRVGSVWLVAPRAAAAAGGNAPPKGEA